jgi:uncharacterized protein YyaL (SSP411 family)
VFVAGALLDAYEHGFATDCLEMAVSAAEYILNELYWVDAPAISGFAYPLPSVRSQVHNANLLAAALFCRVYKLTGEQKFLDPALRVLHYSVERQLPDGGWYYGEAPKQHWIDNFHTGFNLSALRSVARSMDTPEFSESLRRGWVFYRNHFFRPDGSVKYFHDCAYPLDSHCVAQSIISLIELRDLDRNNIALAHSVLRWALEHLWDERGFFYYRRLRSCTIRTSYMRWTQAWMLLATSMLLAKGGPQPTEDAVYQGNR